MAVSFGKIHIKHMLLILEDYVSFAVHMSKWVAGILITHAQAPVCWQLGSSGAEFVMRQCSGLEPIHFRYCA